MYYTKDCIIEENKVIELELMLAALEHNKKLLTEMLEKLCLLLELSLQGPTLRSLR
jgi:hypothetical protein